MSRIRYYEKMFGMITLIILLSIITVLSIIAICVGANLTAAILFGFFVLVPALIIFLYVRMRAFFRRYPIKSVNLTIVFWFLIVFIIGTVGASLIIGSGISMEFSIGELVFGGVFAAVSVIGMIGLIINISAHLQLVKVFKLGTEASGTYLDYEFCYSTGSARATSGRTRMWYSVKFKYYDGAQMVEAKTTACYSHGEVQLLQDKKDFAIKYLNKRAIIIEKIEITE